MAKLFLVTFKMALYALESLLVWLDVKVLHELPDLADRVVSQVLVENKVYLGIDAAYYCID